MSRGGDSSALPPELWQRASRYTWIATALLLPTMVPAFVIGGWALRVSDASFALAALVGWLARRRLGLGANLLVTTVASAGALLQLSVPVDAVTTLIAASVIRSTLLLFAGVGVYAMSFIGGRVGLAFAGVLLVATALVHPVGLLGAVLALALAALLGYMIHGLVEHLAHRERELSAAALVDPLTGLGNRRALERAFDVAVAEAARQDTTLFVSLWDLDALKRTNDERGHEAGDALLRDFAAALTRTLHDQDQAFRIGGDEFCCLHLGLKDGASILARMALAFPSVSGGFAEVGNDSLGTALAQADRAMYAAKRRRRRHDGSDG
ncbi:diguanylate cyclase [Acidimicrobium ferrooxidans DSM 10331]|uniref:Diguanylate cyclase n=1 Tax=Acidimicrobium ferrooxidans (strain DSM 10331 / JCM 15462 / NBRC 103882 / ICP) TaxID=525909 RepID=C7M253_ACIFD|nr:GGDEF domain-containing protein [Acidimicrobium ferrooxidans]ACU53151.1 diguanylate cyclase [Acidimicrobium ferrooxidans DSM 10331]